MSFSALPNDILSGSFLPILQARLERADFHHLSLVSRELSSLLRPLLFHALSFTAGERLAVERVAGLTSSPHLTPLVQIIRFKAIKHGEKEEKQPSWNIWTSLLPLLSHLTSLHVVETIGKVPPHNFWSLLEALTTVNPKAVEITDGFMDEDGPPPSFFLLSGLEEIRFDGDEADSSITFRRKVSTKVKDLVLGNSSTLRKLDIQSQALHLNQILVPDSDNAPTFPSLLSLTIAANVHGVEYPQCDESLNSLATWFHVLLQHTPKLESFSIFPGATSSRSHNGESLRNPNNPFFGVISSTTSLPVCLYSIASPLTETTFLPLLFDKNAVGYLPSLRRLEIARPPPRDSSFMYEWVPFGRKDATEVFDALKGLKGLRKLSVTLGEMGEDLIEAIAAVGAEVGLESLEIELRVGKGEEDASGDGLLWADVLDPLISALLPLGPTLRALVVADNRITTERTSLFHSNDSNLITSLDFLPTILLFAKHLLKLTSVRWITRDGAKDDEIVRDQLWVATVEGGWMRMVG